ncbi:MAG: hypothetical protein ACM3SR_00450 [Ignavibacteriales bacterium]
MKNQRAILKVAIFVLFALLIFMVFIFAFGGESSFFKTWFSWALGFLLYTSQELFLRSFYQLCYIQVSRDFRAVFQLVA